MKGKYVNYKTLPFIIAIITFLLDQITKSIIRDLLSEGEGISIFRDILCITYVKNKGMAFGLFPHAYPFFIAFSIVVIISLIIIIWKNPITNHLFPIACGLLLGGAIGNLLDRIFQNGVVDFIDIGWRNFRYPAFNLADIVICTGVGIILLSIVRSRRSEIK